MIKYNGLWLPPDVAEEAERKKKAHDDFLYDIWM